MSRTIISLACAAAVVLLAPAADARRGAPAGDHVKPAPARAQVRNRATVRRAQRVKLTHKRASARLKAHNTSLTKRQARRRAMVGQKRVSINLNRLAPKTRRAVVSLLSSEAIKARPQAKRMVFQYLRLRSMKGGAGLPLSVADLKFIATSKSWSDKRVSNLSRVLRLARYIAKRDKVSPKEAFRRALKAAGVYKKYASGTCKA